MSDTPITDAAIIERRHMHKRGGSVELLELLDANVSRKLERERNDALNKAHNYEQGYLTHAARADTLEKERNSLQDQRDFAMGEIERLRKERDEALAERDEWIARFRADEQLIKEAVEKHE